MSKLIRALLPVLALSALPSVALAEIVDFDTLPDGTTIPVGASPETETPITTQYASIGVIFSGIFADGTIGAPAATNYAGGPEGPFYQRNYLGNAETGSPFIIGPPFEITPKFEILRLEFTDGADDISLSLNNFSLVGLTTFNAYDQAGNLLETFTTNQGTGWAPRSLSVDDVYRLDLLTSEFNGFAQFFGIDNFMFTPNQVVPPAIPEPASWAMMISGFGLVGGAMRRRVRVMLAA